MADDGDAWPNYLTLSKKVYARGTPNAAMKLAREISPLSIAPPNGALIEAIRLCPSETALQKESNYAMASMTMPYEQWIRGTAGLLAVNTWVDSKGAPAVGNQWTRNPWGGTNDNAWAVNIAGKAYDQRSYGDYASMFSAGAPGVNTWGGSASEWMLNESQLTQTARWWKTNMAKTAAIADVNAAYFIRFAYEKLMVYYTMGSGNATSSPSSGQFVFFAQKFLGFTPGSDWRKYPPYIPKNRY